MAKLSYAEQLRHPFWQRKRLEVLERDGWACASCGAKETTLHVHHKRYIKGTLVWEYELEDLVSYCENCHADDHAARSILDEMLARSTTFETTRWVTSVVGGLLYATYSIDSELAERARALQPTSFDIGILASASGIATKAQAAAFIRGLHETFGGGRLEMDSITAEAVTRWERNAGDKE